MILSIAALKCLVPSSFEMAAIGSGPLDGFRAVVKDLIEVEGHVSSFGHPRWRETHDAATRTAPLVTRLREAGCSIAGFTKMDQLAYSLIGNVGEGEPPLNPSAGDLFCGGSSSGSASAVAGGVVDFGIGTDTAGSIRVPAAACNIHGLRPSHGSMEAAGVVPLAHSFDVVGVLSRSMVTIDKVLRVCSPTVGRSHRRIRKLLFPEDVVHSLLGGDGADIEIGAKQIAEANGWEFVPTKASHIVSAEVGDLFARIQSREIWASHADWIVENGSWLAEDVQSRLDRCKRLHADPVIDQVHDRNARDAYVRRYEDLIGDDAFLALPVVPQRGPGRAWSDGDLFSFRLECFRLTAPSSLSGGPQVVIATSGSRRWTAPIGLVGLPGDDLDLLAGASKALNGGPALELH